MFINLKFRLKAAIFCLILLILFILADRAQAKTVAITIDDLPFVHASKYQQKEVETYFRKILSTLESRNIKATGFVISSHANDDWKKNLLIEMQNRGHQLANHTHTHPRFINTSLSEYIDEIKKAHEFLTSINAPNKIFRYPFLNRGETEEKYEGVKKFLNKNEFKIAPVTIDNSDWKFNAQYQNLVQMGKLRDAIQTGFEYLEHMKEQTKLFDELAKEKTKREIHHILLIHMNRINVEYLGDLLDWYSENGWEFITLKKALEDPVYKIEETYKGPNGWSWLQRF
jgi:peptidoglycan/xylan/chitin deacetylase (PgdA/CDA1 family)